MIEKKNNKEYIFSYSKREKIKVLFKEDNSIELNVIEDDDEIVLLTFNTIKEFRTFCNAITDVIEYKDNEEK